MKKVKYLLFLLLLVSFNVLIAQDEILKENNRPRLVVGIVVDQMRYDYLTRFWEKYSDDGFKRMIKGGYNFKNNHFNYIPTSTGPGHTSVWTGTSPMNHGIIGNNWYDKKSRQMVYCAEDDSVNPVGTESNAGKMSPHRMKSTTVADQNRLHTQMRGKTIGIALKDRGAILPAGHTANAAYWFHGQDEGKWITSSYYMEELPQWVKDFNTSEIANSYVKTWSTLLPINTYTESGADINNFEGGFKGKEEASFPYDLADLMEENKGYDLLKSVPYGNDLTTDFAKAAIKAEELGKDNYTDFLTLSFSSTDYIGHNFGVNAKEIQDAYLRLDKNIASLLRYLDNEVGEGNYTVFLTSDHGAGNVPSYLKSLKIPAGNFSKDDLINNVKDLLITEFGVDNLILNVSNNQIYLDHKLLRAENLKAELLEKIISGQIIQEENVSNVYTRAQLQNGIFTTGIAASLQNGFNQKRSGDVFYITDPGYIGIRKKTGTSHGSGYGYDTHAPLIFFGKGIKKGSTTKRSEITDIAPTVASLLGIAFPNSTSGRPLHEMLDN